MHMYKIVDAKTGQIYGAVETVTYIKISDNGTYIVASPDEAVGVAFNSNPYNLIGHDEISGAKTIVPIEFNSGDDIFKLNQAADDNDEMSVDMEYRLTMLELGLNETEEV